MLLKSCVSNPFLFYIRPLRRTASLAVLSGFRLRLRNICCKMCGGVGNVMFRSVSGFVVIKVDRLRHVGTLSFKMPETFADLFGCSLVSLF